MMSVQLVGLDSGQKMNTEAPVLFTCTGELDCDSGGWCCDNGESGGAVVVKVIMEVW